MISLLKKFNLNLIFVIISFSSLFLYTLSYKFWSTYNYIFFIFSLIVFLNIILKNNKIELNRNITLIYIFFIIILSIPILYSNFYYAKGILNQYIFIFISVTICLAFIKIRKNENLFHIRKIDFNIFFDKIINYSLFILLFFYLLCILYLNFFHYHIFNIFYYTTGNQTHYVGPTSWQFKSNYDFYLQGLSIFDFKKQEVGNSLFFFFAILIVSNLKKFFKYFLFIFILVFLSLSVRQILVSGIVFSFLFYLSYLIHKNKKNTLFILIIIFILLCLTILRYFNDYLNLQNLSSNDPRVSILSNTIHTLKDNSFGWGFQSYQNLYNTSSESDVVSVLLNFGVIFGSIFYLIHFILMFNYIKFFYYISKFDRFIFIFFGLFLFSGIGEDNMFRLTHWIITGLFLGSYYYNKKIYEKNIKKI